MTHLLDTNACIRYLNGRSESLRRRIDAASEQDLSTCSVVRAEMCFGAMKSRAPDRALELQRQFLSRFFSYSFDDLAADRYGPIRAELERAGTPIGANDLMIAAISLANGLTLVTHNIEEFKRVRGLMVEDWEAIAG